MYLLIEGFKYNLSSIEDILDESLYFILSGDKAIIPYVGYYFSPKLNDSIFILPKVFISEIDGEKKAFGRYDPESIIDGNNEELEANKDQEVIFGLSTWLYRAIAHYVESHKGTRIAKEAYIHNVVSTKGGESYTSLEIALDLIKFNKENRNLFTYISIVNASGRNKINWNKTINRTLPVIQKKKPIYTSLYTKDKTINYDEELIVLFYSVLNYLHTKYSFKVAYNLKYETIKPEKIQEYIDSGKGTRILKKIRHKYFKDEFIKLWNLLYVFFDKGYRVATKKHKEEKLLVSNFNLVFEDMIDQLISDPNIPQNLKYQDDNKIVDHIFRESSFIPGSEIYFVGDSKYYMEGNDIQGAAFFKQYTYAKNIIQVNVDIFNENPSELGKIRYIDDLTEGYNVTPNFFIRGEVNPNNINYSDLDLVNDGLPIDEARSFHWENRLFDRDTLILQCYNVNFLYVLTTYVNQLQDISLKRRIRRKFRMDIINVLNSNYTFYKITPTIPLEVFVNKYFRILNGKIYRGKDTDTYIWLAFEKDKVDNATLETISKDSQYILTDLPL